MKPEALTTLTNLAIFLSFLIKSGRIERRSWTTENGGRERKGGRRGLKGETVSKGRRYRVHRLAEEEREEKRDTQERGRLRDRGEGNVRVNKWEREGEEERASEIHREAACVEYEWNGGESRDTEPRAGCWEAAAAAAMLPYPERRENDPREHREAASFVACSGGPNFGRLNSTCAAR